MIEHDRDRMKTLLQQAMPHVEDKPEPSRDLWPALLRRMEAQPAIPAEASWNAFDCALALGLAALFALFPASIPVLLYYL